MNQTVEENLRASLVTLEQLNEKPDKFPVTKFLILAVAGIQTLAAVAVAIEDVAEAIHATTAK